VESAPAASERSEFILADFRVSKVVAERFRAPEAARSGTYSINSSADTVKFHVLESKRTGSVTYSLTVVGRTNSKADDQDGNAPTKSFSIAIEAEGRFEIFGPLDTTDEVQCAVLLEPVLILMHGLCVHNARAEADSMGYRTIRPSYQARNMSKPLLEAIPTVL
jgi:hypothetical protein